jgi:hypothetical protein
MEVQSDVQHLEPLPPAAAASPPPGANQRSECEEGHRDTGASADSHSEDTPASQRDEMKVRPAARRCMSPMGPQVCASAMCMCVVFPIAVPYASEGVVCVCVCVCVCVSVSPRCVDILMPSQCLILMRFVISRAKILLTFVL